MDFQEKSDLFKVRKTILEMISDRGYSIPDEENISFEEFSSRLDQIEKAQLK